MATITQPDTIQDIDQLGKEETIPPYKVIFLNDEVTTMDFVIHLIVALFKKDPSNAVEIMLEIHNTGAGIVDILPLEEAELRQEQSHTASRSAGYPLRCVIEPA